MVEKLFTLRLKDIWSIMKKNNLIGYQERSEFYDLEFSGLEDEVLIDRYLSKGNVNRILEIPCGSSRYLDKWEKSGKEVVLSDISEEMLNIVREKEIILIVMFL